MEQSHRTTCNNEEAKTSGVNLKTHEPEQFSKAIKDSWQKYPKRVSFFSYKLLSTIKKPKKAPLLMLALVKILFEGDITVLAFTLL